jgi:hypothetical protein
LTARAQSLDVRTFFSALLLSFVFGSIHAFGVLLQPLQISLQSDRAGDSLVYSVAIASLTIGVCASDYLGSRVCKRILKFAGRLIGFCGLRFAVCGLLLADCGTGIVTYLRGRGLNFGFYNGFADLPVSSRKIYFQQQT